MSNDALLRGTLAAAVTPLQSGGRDFDDEAFGPLLDRYVAAGLDGVLDALADARAEIVESITRFNRAKRKAASPANAPAKSGKAKP